MWCPEGYYSWSYVLGRLFDASTDILSLVSKIEKKLNQADASGDVNELLRHAEFLFKSHGYASAEDDTALNVGITACFLMSYFLEDYPPTLASLEGQFITVEGTFLEHRDQLHLCPYGWPLKTQGEFFQFFNYAKNGKFEFDTILERFAFIDAHTGEFRVKNGSKDFLLNYTHHSEESATKAVNLAKRLTGFVLCWEDLPGEAEFRNFLSYLEVNDAFIEALNRLFGPAKEAEEELSSGSTRPIGRPSKKASARRAYWSLFPEGHEKAGKVWKEAHQAVVDELEGTVEITTLKRAVREGRQKGQN